MTKHRNFSLTLDCCCDVTKQLISGLWFVALSVSVQYNDCEALTVTGCMVTLYKVTFQISYSGRLKLTVKVIVGGWVT